MKYKTSGYVRKTCVVSDSLLGVGLGIHVDFYILLCSFWIGLPQKKNALCKMTISWKFGLGREFSLQLFEVS